MSLTFKRSFFFLLLGAALGSLWLGHGWLAFGDLGLLFAWLAYETHLRQRFSFVALGRLPERLLAFEQELHTVVALAQAPVALVVEHGPRLAMVDTAKAHLLWQRSFAAQAPLAVLPLPDGTLLWASEAALHWTDAAGNDAAELAFEPPLYRQSYRLLLSADGRAAALHTPWFVQAFDPVRRTLGGRIRYEDAGHYFKYAAFSPDGRGLLLAGALLLTEEESGGGDLEARWDWWVAGDSGTWAKAWGKAYPSYNNTHLRGVAVGGGGSVLQAEVFQSGYEFKLFTPKGNSLWERPGGEHPVLSPRAHCLAWENSFDGLVLSRVADQQKLWSHKPADKIRFKAADDQGRCLFLEGRHLRLFGADGVQAWDAWLKVDPEELSLGQGGRLAVISGTHAGILQLPWDV